jgi:hypothetical protein
MLLKKENYVDFSIDRSNYHWTCGLRADVDSVAPAMAECGAYHSLRHRVDLAAEYAGSLDSGPVTILEALIA